MTTTAAFAATSATAPLAPQLIKRREPGQADVEMEILFCGVCHSDIHQARNEWHNTVYPCVPGHEIVGRVTRVGTGVTRFKPGDLSAVGCMVDSSPRASEYAGPAWSSTAGPRRPSPTTAATGSSAA